MRPPRLVLLCLMAIAALAAVHAEETLAPCLESEPGVTGAVTWWLVSPALPKAALAGAKPPLHAREGSPLEPGGAAQWKVFITPSPVVDMRAQTTARSGTIWLSARCKALRAGTRSLRVASFCAVRVFKDGQLVLDKPQPAAPYADEAEAQIELAAETSELTVGLEIRGGYCGAQIALCERQGRMTLPRAAEGDVCLLPTAAGETPDPLAALQNSLAFQAQETFLDGGQTTTLHLGFAGSRPKISGALKAEVAGAGGKAIGDALPPRTVPELAQEPWRVRFTLPPNAEFQQTVIAQISLDGKPAAARTLNVFALEGLTREAGAVAAEVRACARQAQRPLPNAALAVEKLQLHLEKIRNGAERISRDAGARLLSLLAQARAYAAEEAAGKDPLAGQTGCLERAYISRIDEQPQPYFCNVPSAFAQAKPGGKFPLIVFLHGYVPSYDKHRWWDEMPEFNAVADRNNAFLAIPFGRSNTDFQSCGETDVLDVIAEVKRLYPVDEDRVYLYGYSMGGMAVYTIGAHHPELFAAGVVFCGRADSPLQNFKPLETFHPFKQRLIQADNPISLCGNLLNVPLQIYHGRSDGLIDISEAVRMEKRLKEAGCDAALNIYDGDHWTGFDIMGTDAPVKWLLAHKRKNPPAVQSPGNGLGRKSIGPVRKAVCGPFLIAYGTTGNDDANARNKANAERFAKEWFAFTRSRALIKADKDVTGAEKQSKSLFLFGEEQENSLHAAAASSLPVRVKNGRITAGEKTVALEGKGVMCIYPSPFSSAEHSVVICAGIPYGQSIGANHKLDLVPDFLIYTGQTDTDGTGTNHAVCAGFFDGQWKLDPKTTWWFDK